MILLDDILFCFVHGRDVSGWLYLSLQILFHKLLVATLLGVNIVRYSFFFFLLDMAYSHYWIIGLEFL